MAIPDAPEFSSLLGSLSLAIGADTCPREQHLELCPASFAIDGELRIPEPAIFAGSALRSELGLSAVLSKIEAELRFRRHRDDRALAHALLGVFCLDPLRHRSPVHCLNRLLDAVVAAQLTQFYVWPAPPPLSFRSFRFSAFTVGTLNWHRLESRSRMAGSDYFGRYETTLIGKMAVERDAVEVRIVDWNSVGATLETSEHARVVWDRLVNFYFSKLSESLFEEFWDVFDAEQALQVAAGAPLLPAREMRVILGSPISIYIAENWGHVAPSFSNGIAVSLADADHAIPAVLNELKLQYGFERFLDTELHRSLNVFSQFVAKAKRFATLARSRDDAGLFYVIALDLLLGEQDKLNKTVSERAAVIIHRPKGISYSKAVRLLSAIYDARSKYVHRGQPFSCDIVKHADAVSTEAPELPIKTLGRGIVRGVVTKRDFIRFEHHAKRQSSAKRWYMVIGEPGDYTRCFRSCHNRIA